MFASFHIFKAGSPGHLSLRPGSKWTGHYLVYKNNEGGTRDFIGFINEMTGEPVEPGVLPNSPGHLGPGWIVTGMNTGNAAVGSRSCYDGIRYPTKNEAAKALYDKVRAYIPPKVKRAMR